MSVSREELGQYFEKLLQCSKYVEPGHNGLQVEGSSRVRRVAFAVTASRAVIDRAVDLRVDALVVHHGILWKFHGARPIVGAVAARLRPLLGAGINLFGFHLPLDGHQELGNAAGIARRLGATQWQPFGFEAAMPVGVSLRLPRPQTAEALRTHLAELLSHPVLMSTYDETAEVATLGIVTGGANRRWSEAAVAGLDAFLTGEMSEHDWHEAQEGGVHMFAGGHHATEVFGVQQLMERTRADLGLDCLMIEYDNPA